MENYLDKSILEQLLK